jgi:hypothetical protein
VSRWTTVLNYGSFFLTPCGTYFRESLLLLLRLLTAIRMEHSVGLAQLLARNKVTELLG